MSDELWTFRCDGVRDGIPCGAQYTGQPHDLAGEGWQHMKLERHRDLFLCSHCAWRFGAIWKKNERKAA